MVLALILSGCFAAGSAAAPVTGAAMRAIDAPAYIGDWMSYGRGWDEQRFSPLDQIDEGNVGGLGLAWFDAGATFQDSQTQPRTLQVVELFRLTGGAIEQVEAFTADLPHGMKPR